MSGACGNCDCSDQTKCVKKGYTAEITEKRNSQMIVMDAPISEHDGKCKCGSSCTCTNCICCH